MARALRSTVLALLLIRFVDEAGGFLAPGSVERFRDDLGISYGLAGGLFAAGALAVVPAGLVVAASDGRSRKPVTVGGTFVAAAGLALFALAGGPVALLVASALVVAGATALVDGGEIALANGVPDEHLERFLARTNLAAVGGDIAGPLVLAATRALGIGWRPVFAVAAVLTAAYGALLSRLPFPSPPIDSAGRGVGAPDPRTAGEDRRGIVAVWLVGVAALATAPLDESYLAAVLAFAEQEQGFSPAGAALLGTVFVSGGVLSFTLLPGWVARVSTSRLLATCGVAMATVMVVAALGPGWMLVPLGVAHSALLGAVWLGLQALVLRAQPGREGRAILIVSLIELFSAVPVVALGVVADRAGLRAELLAFTVLGVVLVGPAVAFRRRPSADDSLDPLAVEADDGGALRPEVADELEQ